MFTITSTVQNAYGIHCRPAGVITKAVQGYKGKIEIKGADGNVANPASVLSLLSLGLTCGDRVTITVDGPDEEAIANKLATLIASHFDFEK
ncbi:MAG: HPr family phosphocarrier protein [Lentisphaerae bacterium]|jgi:phosphocarrier protein|nr:HPr family phosphocarrier protein [Lentisphaerota bacterium]